MNYISNQTIDHVRATAAKAVAKHGAHTPLSKGIYVADKLVILVEEVGEVARCCTYDKDHAGDLYRELLDVAAMALLWAEAIDY